MFSLATSGDCEVEKEKPRILPGMIPQFAQLFGGFPGGAGPMRNFPMPPTTTTTPGASSPPSNPNGLFPPFLGNFAQYYAILQQQQSQFMAQFANAAGNSKAHALNGSNNSESNSSVLSDSRASSTDSATKKLKVDNDGNMVCPICDEKLPNDSNWELHLENERKNLIKSIESIKDQKSNIENMSERVMATNRSQQKREAELHRIRSNQQKRLTLKSINPLSSSRGDLFDSSSSSRSTSADKNYCKGCERHHDYLIISASLDEPRCYDCFRKYRQQVSTFLPLSITESSSENDLHQASRTPPTPNRNHSVDTLLNPRKRPSPPITESSPSKDSGDEKRIKIES